MSHFKKIIERIVAVAFFAIPVLSLAGSYDEFFKAIRLDHPGTVQKLLERGFDPNTVAPDGVPALMKSLQEQSFAVAHVLVNAPDIRPDVRNGRDESPLMLAALRGQETLVIRLVSLGAAVNKHGWTPLHYAATGGHARVAAFLIGAQADIHAESPNGTTPLMMAAMYGNAETVKLLLESGAQPDRRNAQGLSAEDFALRADRQDALQLIRQVLSR